MRLDTHLRTLFPAASRGALQRLLELGHITVNGRRAKPTSHPMAGDVIDVTWPDPKPLQAPAQEMPLEILHEDSDLLVLNKAAGVVVHPGAGHDDHTLVNALLHHCRGQLSGIGGVARPGIVHRLDKDTSGCLVVAKNDPTHIALSQQFAERSVQKEYQALLCGGAISDAGEIRAPIGRHPVKRKRMAVIDRGRDAWTSFRVLRRFPQATLVTVLLHTGRTHQIRVHFEHVGAPLLGDLVYGKRHNARLRESTGFEAPRQMLHARRLQFRHPKTGEWLRFESPLPTDFTEVCRVLERQSGVKDVFADAGWTDRAVVGDGDDDGDLEWDEGDEQP